jgi:hypothetical protein
MCGRLGHLRCNLIGGDTGAWQRADLNLRQGPKRTTRNVYQPRLVFIYGHGGMDSCLFAGVWTCTKYNAVQ